MNKKINWGFDLTDFKSADIFEMMIKKHKLKGGKRVYRDGLRMFVWKNKNIELITMNNPITGQYHNPRQRKSEKGYASYIGITGNEKAVLSLVKDIKKNTLYIKGESKYDREFI